MGPGRMSRQCLLGLHHSPWALPPALKSFLEMSSLSLPLSGWGLGAGGPPAPGSRYSARALARRRRRAAVLSERRPGSQVPAATRHRPGPRPRLPPLRNEGPGWALRGATGVPHPSAPSLRGKLWVINSVLSSLRSSATEPGALLVGFSLLRLQPAFRKFPVSPDNLRADGSSQWI